MAIAYLMKLFAACNSGGTAKIGKLLQIADMSTVRPSEN